MSGIELQFALALDEGQRLITPGVDLSIEMRRYVERINKVRLHQPMFRARVLAAYQSRCTVCQLRHAELLDAAHIISDNQPHGDPVVPNGLAMCKIHHAAFDSNIWVCDQTSAFTFVRTFSTRSTALCCATDCRACTT